MRVRVHRVEVVRGDPFEVCPKIAFHPTHEPPDERAELMIFNAIFWRDYNSELMAVVLGARQKRVRINLILLRRIKMAGVSLSSNSAPFKIAEIGTHRGKTDLREFYDSRIYNRASGKEARVAIAHLKHPRGNHSSSATRSHIFSARARSNAKAAGGLQDLADK